MLVMLLQDRDTDIWVRIIKAFRLFVMVIPNGTIQVYSTQGGGYDEHGNPIPVEETLGEPIPCNWKRNTYEKRGTYENGQFTAASYIVLVDIQEFSPCRFVLKGKKTSMNGNVEYYTIGIYEVQQKGIAFLDYVGCIELTV